MTIRTVKYEILQDVCCSCGVCARACKPEAIVLNPGEKAFIDQAKCTACGECVQSCKLRAILKKRGLFAR